MIVMPRRLSDEIASRVRALIEEQQLEAGMKLPAERQLAAQLGVSRNSLREALATLVSEGVLTASPGRGYFVANRSRQANVIHEPECMAGDPLFRLLQGGQHYTKLGSGWLPPAWR